MLTTQLFTEHADPVTSYKKYVNLRKTSRQSRSGQRKMDLFLIMTDEAQIHNLLLKKEGRMAKAT